MSIQNLVLQRGPSFAGKPSPTAVNSDDFETTVGDHVADHIHIWQEGDERLPTLGPRFGRSPKRWNARRCNKLIGSLERHFGHYPNSVEDQPQWRCIALESIRRFAKSCLGYSDAEWQLLFSEEYQQVTRDFVGQARVFDEAVPMDDLYQALRNVWIMNSIQILMGLQVRLTHSVFAYSMLYPYTDNFLDEPGVSRQQKCRFNRWIERRLKDDGVEPRNDREQSLHRLFHLIEQEHADGVWHNVYPSVLAIHRAQQSSLDQHVNAASVSDFDLLRLSVHKGGTSVLAHGYLVNGQISHDQAHFLFGYGVFLQLVDDLQDIERDLRNGHMTLFTREVLNKGNIDRIIIRSIGMMKSTLRTIDRFHVAEAKVVKTTIWRNCVLLILAAVAGHHAYCSRKLLRQLESYSPLRFSYVRACRKKLMRKHCRIKRILLEYKDLETIWDVLGPPSKRLWNLSANHDSDRE